MDPIDFFKGQVAADALGSTWDTYGGGDEGWTIELLVAMRQALALESIAASLAKIAGEA